MAFHEQSFSSRFGTMGDTAEQAYDIYEPKNHKLGLNRPPFHMSRMPATMRYTPDRMTNKAFVECMGIGRDGTLKIKDEKVDALAMWLQLGPVELFVFDQSKSTCYIASLAAWGDKIETYGTPDTFPEGKAYSRLHRNHFPCEPIPIDPEG